MTAFVPSPSVARSKSVIALNLWQESSFLTASTTTQEMTTAATMTPATTFEPVLPETSVLFGFAGILILSALAGWVWANQVVPVSRTNLAISKRSGPVKDYLDELRAAESSATTATNVTGTATNATADTRDFERWMFTDWLDKPKSKGGRQKEPALPVLKDAKWNSGDNPVLAASALIGLGVLFTSVTERIASQL